MGERVPEVARFQGLANEFFEALGECFQRDRILAAGIGIGIAFVLAGSAGTGAAAYLLQGPVSAAIVLTIVAALLAYAGLLLAYGALCRIAVAARHGQAVSVWNAFGFAVRRSHLLVGLPLCVLIVVIGVGSLGSHLGAALSASRSVGAVVAPLVILLLFVINLFLVTGLMVSHCLTAPCVACLDPSFATIASRLIGVARAQLASFYAHQVAALVVGIPLLLFSVTIFAAAFQPAVSAAIAGRAQAMVAQRADQLISGVEPGQRSTPRDETGMQLAAWQERLGSFVLRAGAGVMSIAAVLALVLGILPLIYAAAAESTIYLALTGDRMAAPTKAEAELEAVAPVRHPPIAHCWRCDAINRYEAQSCSKCGAALAVCPYCFATNEPEREECSSCGQRLGHSGE